MRKKKKQSHILKFVFFISVITIISIFIIKKQNPDIELAELPKNNTTIKGKEKEINESSSFPNDVYGVPVYTDLIDINEETRPGTKRKIKYIVIHETDNFEVRSRSKKSC